MTNCIFQLIVTTNSQPRAESARTKRFRVCVSQSVCTTAFYGCFGQFSQKTGLASLQYYGRPTRPRHVGRTGAPITVNDYDVARPPTVGMYLSCRLTNSKHRILEKKKTKRQIKKSRSVWPMLPARAWNFSESIFIIRYYGVKNSINNIDCTVSAEQLQTNKLNCCTFLYIV